MFDPGAHPGQGGFRAVVARATACGKGHGFLTRSAAARRYTGGMNTCDVAIVGAGSVGAAAALAFARAGRRVALIDPRPAAAPGVYVASFVFVLKKCLDERGL